MVLKSTWASARLTATVHHAANQVMAMSIIYGDLSHLIVLPVSSRPNGKVESECPCPVHASNSESGGKG